MATKENNLNMYIKLRSFSFGSSWEGSYVISDADGSNKMMFSMIVNTYTSDLPTFMSNISRTSCFRKERGHYIKFFTLSHVWQRYEKRVFGMTRECDSSSIYSLFSNVICTSVSHLSDPREIMPTHK